jgi:hypothetical protein
MIALGAVVSGHKPRGRPPWTVSPCRSLATVRGTLGPGATRTWPLCYPRGMQARLLVDARGGGDVDCYVYAPSRSLVARDDGESNACALEWIPRDSGTYTLDLVNAGSSPSEYAATPR